MTDDWIQVINVGGHIRMGLIADRPEPCAYSLLWRRETRRRISTDRVTLHVDNNMSVIEAVGGCTIIKYPVDKFIARLTSKVKRITMLRSIDVYETFMMQVQVTSTPTLQTVVDYRNQNIQIEDTVGQPQ